MELNQRCWNHEAREAACRCPACGRSYCRECVSEHEGRLLCAACLSRITANRVRDTGGFRRLAPPAMIAAGILLAWLIYWAAGVSLIGLIRRMEQEPSSTVRRASWPVDPPKAEARSAPGPARRRVPQRAASKIACPTMSQDA